LSKVSKSSIKFAPIQKRLGNFDQLRDEWKVTYLLLKTAGEDDGDHSYWINEESHYESICVGWCMAKGLTLIQALDFYQAMIPLRLF
jgi:hypothetical protein